MQKRIREIGNRGEYAFACVLKAQGKQFIHQPARFRLGDTSYSPDFYVVEDQTFYEVVGTRQAYHQDKHKIEALKAVYPFVQLKLVRPDGTDYKGSNGDASLIGDQPINLDHPQLTSRHINIYGNIDPKRNRRMRRLGFDIKSFAEAAHCVPSTIKKWLCCYELSDDTAKKVYQALKDREQQQGT